MFNIKTKKTISCLLLLAFSATTFLTDTGLSDTLGIWSFKEQPTYCQMLSDMYLRNRLIWVANSYRYQELLIRYNSQALLLPSGRYLMSSETKDNPLALIRAVAHEDFEILWQKEERMYPERYAALKARILANKKILDTYLALPSQSKLNHNDRILFNDLMSTAFELHFILQEKVIKRESLIPEESAFSAIMEPVIRELQVKDPAGNHTDLSELFFDKEARLSFIFNIQKTKKTKSEKFMRVAKEEKAVKGITNNSLSEEAIARRMMEWYQRIKKAVADHIKQHDGQRPTQGEVAGILGVTQGHVSKYLIKIRLSHSDSFDPEAIRMRGPIPKKRKTYVSDEKFIRVRSDFIEKNGRLPSGRELEGLLNITKKPVSTRLKKLGLLPFHSPRKGKNIIEKEIIAAFEEYKKRHNGIAPEQADLVRMLGCSTVSLCEKLLRINIGNLSNAKPFLLTRSSRRFAPKEADGASRIDPAAASFESIKDAADHIISRVDIVLKDESELERLAGFRYTNSVRLVRDSLEAARNALIRFVKEGNIYSIPSTISERVTFKFGYCSGDRLYIYEGLIDPKSPEYRQEDVLASILLQILLKSLFTNDRFIDEIQDSLSLKRKNIVKRRSGTRSEYLGFVMAGALASLWDRAVTWLKQRSQKSESGDSSNNLSLNTDLDRMYLEHFELDNLKAAHPVFLLMQKLKQDAWVIKHIIAAVVHTVTWIVKGIWPEKTTNALDASVVQSNQPDDVTQSAIYRDLLSHIVTQRDIDDLLNEIAKNRSKASNVLSYIMAHADEFDKECLILWCKGLIRSAFAKILEEYVHGKTRLSGMNIIESDLVLRKLWLELCFMQVLPDENLLERFYSFAGYNRLASSREEYWDLIAQSDYQFAGKESVVQIKRVIKDAIVGPSLDLLAGRSIYYRPDVALDVSDNFLKRNPARSKVVFDISHLDKDKKLPFEDGAFKTVTIFFGINYIHDLDRLVKEVNRILAPGGKFIVASSERAGIGAIKEASVTLGRMANYVKDNGFAIMQIEHLFNDGGETGYVLFMKKDEGSGGSERETRAREVMWSLRPDFGAKANLSAAEFEAHVKKMAAKQGVEYVKFPVGGLKTILVPLDLLQRFHKNLVRVVFCLFQLVTLFSIPSQARSVSPDGKRLTRLITSYTGKTAFIAPIIAAGVVALVAAAFYSNPLSAYISLLLMNMWISNAVFSVVFGYLPLVRNYISRHELKHAYMSLLLNELVRQKKIDVDFSEAKLRLGTGLISDSGLGGWGMFSLNRINLHEIEKMEDYIIRSVVSKTAAKPPTGSIAGALEHLAKTDANSAKTGKQIAQELGLAYASIDTDLRALYYHLHLIEKVDRQETGKAARYYVPESVKKKLNDKETSSKIFQILSRFKGNSGDLRLRPNRTTLKYIYKNKIKPILKPPESIDESLEFYRWAFQYGPENFWFKVSGKRVLDLGSGLGALSIWAKEHWAKEVVGIDVNSESITRAKKIAKEKGLEIRYEKGDATQIRFEDSRFGVVTSGRTLEFLTANTRRAALKEIQRVLKTNGTLLIVIHDDEGRHIDKGGRVIWPDGYWDEKVWETELNDAGFANVHIDMAWPTEQEAPAKIIYATKLSATMKLRKWCEDHSGEKITQTLEDLFRDFGVSKGAISKILKDYDIKLSWNKGRKNKPFPKVLKFRAWAEKHRNMKTTKTPAGLSRIFGLSPSVVYENLRDYNIETPVAGSILAGQRLRAWAKKHEGEKLDRTLEDIAKEYGLTRQGVQQSLKKYNITASGRPGKQQPSLAGRKFRAWGEKHRNKNTKKTLTQLSKIFDLSQSYISRLLTDYNIEASRSGSVLAGQKLRAWAEKHRNKKINMTQPELADKFGIRQSSVSRILGEYGIKTRGRVKKATTLASSKPATDSKRHYTGLGAMDADAVPYPSSGDRSQLQYSSEKAWRAEMPIGIVDSGLGGLSVAEALRRSMPNEKLLCLIDTANFPYGSKSEEELIRIKDDNMNLLSSQGVKAIVIACGTLSTVGYTDRSLYGLPIVNFVDALAKEAVRSTRTGNIGVLATQATIQTGVFQRKIESLGIGMRALAVGCSDRFVELVEKGEVNTPQARKVVEEEIAILKINGVDTIVLGCSHYTFLRDVIQDIMGTDVNIISSEQAVANEVAELLKTKELLAAQPARAGPPVFVTGPHSGLQDKIYSMLGAHAKYQIIPYKTAKVSRGSAIRAVKPIADLKNIKTVLIVNNDGKLGSVASFYAGLIESIRNTFGNDVIIDYVGADKTISIFAGERNIRNIRGISSIGVGRSIRSQLNGGEEYDLVFDFGMNILHKDEGRRGVYGNYNFIMGTSPSYSDLKGGVAGTYHIRAGNQYAAMNEFFDKLGMKRPGTPYLRATEGGRSALEAELAAKGIGGQDKIIFLNPNGVSFAHMTRNKLIAEWSESARLIAENTDYYIVMQDDPTARSIYRYILANYGEKIAKKVKIVKHSDIIFLKALIDRSLAVLTVDTSVYHVAAAMGKPFFVVGFDDQFKGWYPGKMDSVKSAFWRLDRKDKRDIADKAKLSHMPRAALNFINTLETKVLPKDKLKPAFGELDKMVRSQASCNAALTDCGRTLQNVRDASKLRLVIPVEVLKNSVDITLVLKKKIELLKVPFRLEVTGVDDSDAALVEGLKEKLGIKGDVTITAIKEKDIRAKMGDIYDRTRVDVPEIQSRVEAIKRLSRESQGLDAKEYMAIVTGAVIPDEASTLEEILKDQLEDNISIMVTTNNDPSNSLYMLADIINNWLKDMQSGNLSTIIRLPALVSPEEMIGRLGESVRMAWAALIAA